MLQNRATLKDIRTFLLAECGKVYPPGEASSISLLILEHLGIRSLKAILEPDYQPGPVTVAQIKTIVNEIHKLRPIQYILGESLFYGIRIRVDERVLIPRQETEELVHLIVEESLTPPGEVLDLGCGSGCISLALKKAFPKTRIRGMDHSEGALELSRENALLNALDVEWISGDILDGPLPQSEGKGYSMIVSNPPYVRESEKELMHDNVLNFEPETALFVNDDDPLLFYRAIARKAKHVLVRNGKLWLEINEAFGDKMSVLLKEHEYRDIEILKDIHGKERFAKATF